MPNPSALDIALSEYQYWRDLKWPDAPPANHFGLVMLQAGAIAAAANIVSQLVLQREREPHA